MSPAWLIQEWPRIACAVDRVPRLRFAHMSTLVLSPGDTEQPALGQTIWRGDSELGSVGLAWDWVRLPAGIVAMADPMSLFSNLQVTDAQGRALKSFELARQLNGIVHALPWQLQVQWALNETHGASLH